MSDKLTQLKAMTIVVADTGDIDSMKRFKPQDATTNPSLLLKAARMPRYESLVSDAAQWAETQGGDQKTKLINRVDRLFVLFGKEILNIVPGRVSTEVDARLSFDTNATLTRVRRLIELYQQEGIGPERVLIKIAATWEGIAAAEILEKEGIQCNLTLLFGFAQAAACANAGVFLISPFVGRILDWHKKDTGLDYSASQDPGVLSVGRIYRYYKKFGFKTIVMGASFRSAGEICELAGCDRLTIGPNFLEELQQDTGHLEQKLSEDQTGEEREKFNLDEKSFRWMHNQDAMATEKLAEGIRLFSRDLESLEEHLAKFVS